MNSRRFLPVLLGLGVFATRLTAAPSSGSTPTSEPTKSYTDQGSTTSQVDTNFRPTYYNNTSFAGDFGRSFGGSTTTYYTSRYQVLVSPPIPPALGEPVPARPAKPTLAKFSPTATLSGFVYEPFFTPLSPLLFSEDLSRSRREKLDAYRTNRAAALAALRAKLASLQAGPAATRQTELAAFAREQAPVLAGLERSAEEMRANYVDGGFFQASYDWNDSRSWRLGDNTRWESNADEIKVMFGAAYFQDGLSPAQRRLLRELAMELIDSLNSPLNEISLSAPGPFFYFSPEMARIRLPAEMPDELRLKIETYRNEKAALKQEIRTVLYKEDRSFFDYRRTNALKALAEQQAARFTALEQTAEEIRAGLAPLANPAKPPTIALPHDLLERVGRYWDAKDQWQKTMLAKLEALRNALPEDRVEFVRQKDSLQIQVVANRRSKQDVAAKRDALLAELAPFNAEHAASYAALARDKEMLRNEVLKAASAIAGRTSNKSIEMLLAEFSYAFSLQERWDRFADYETAVLQPGLSPEQRRLLFGAAIESLDLPLAGGF